VELCRRDARFEPALKDPLPIGRLKGRRIEVDRPIKEGFFFVIPLKGFHFVPLITRPFELACGLDITFLRRERPGDIVTGGDLDKRLKSLFDAMRLPHNENELQDIMPAHENERLYCVLEDDSLITRLSIDTQQLLEPPVEGEKETDVHLTLKVTVEVTYLMWGNVGFAV
jgi:hypothetical protein